MTGTAGDIIPIVIVPVLALAFLLIMVYYANSHPQWANQPPTETGSAQLGVRDISPQQDAVINGAEQENIPARYRFYVQRYFEHSNAGKQ